MVSANATETGLLVLTKRLGYILCAITRTVAQNVLVGSVSYASEGARAMRNVSTASAVEVVTPYAKHLAFRVSPIHPCAFAT